MPHLLGTKTMPPASEKSDNVYEELNFISKELIWKSKGII
jgi:hypothetical protein